MKLVLTNDDGYGAPGLEVLVDLFSSDHDVVVVAPKDPQSGVGHRVTTRDPICVRELDSNRFSVAGTPADCARIALKSLVPDVDWLVAGINPGANLGSDVYNSGTVAAAREATILGHSAIAISQYIAREKTIDWEITGEHARRVLNFLMARELESGSFWNVNLPHPLRVESRPDYSICALDIHPHLYRYRISGDSYLYEGTIHERPFDTGTDVAQCFSGNVAITPIIIQTSRLDCAFPFANRTLIEGKE